MFDNNLQNIFQLRNGQSRSINWENRNGEKGKGGMASGNLGPSRKGSPCIPKIEAGETVTLGEIQGEGMIQHIWITVTDRTSERNRYVLRDLVLRMYWDDEEFPSVECPLGDFFCCGFGVSYQVNSVPIAVNPTRGFNSCFPMPFRKTPVLPLKISAMSRFRFYMFHDFAYRLQESVPNKSASNEFVRKRALSFLYGIQKALCLIRFRLYPKMRL